MVILGPEAEDRIRQWLKGGHWLLVSPLSMGFIELLMHVEGRYYGDRGTAAGYECAVYYGIPPYGLAVIAACDKRSMDRQQLIDAMKENGSFDESALRGLRENVVRDIVVLAHDLGGAGEFMRGVHGLFNRIRKQPELN